MSEALPPTAVNTQSSEQRYHSWDGGLGRSAGLLSSSSLSLLPAVLASRARQGSLPLFLPLSAEALLFPATSPGATGIQSILYDRAMGSWMGGGHLLVTASSSETSPNITLTAFLVEPPLAGLNPICPCYLHEAWVRLGFVCFFHLFSETRSHIAQAIYLSM